MIDKQAIRDLATIIEDDIKELTEHMMMSQEIIDKEIERNNKRERLLIENTAKLELIDTILRE